MNTTTPIHEIYVDSTVEPDSIEKAERIAEAFDILGGVLDSYDVDQVDTPEEAKAMVVLGGDGAFLHSLRRHAFPDIPATGINTGTLGFYMDTLPTEESIDAMVRQLVSGSYFTKHLPLLEVPIGQTGEREYAINEVVIGRKSLQAFNASLQLGEGEFEHFVGDSFIFSTPQGSTSYSLSAGGPILQEDIDAYIVTPSNPHRSNYYYSLAAPTVVSGDVEALVTVKDVEKRPLKVSVDAHLIEEWPVDEHQVRVRVARDKKLQVIRFDGHDYFRHVSNTFRGKQMGNAPPDTYVIDPRGISRDE